MGLKAHVYFDANVLIYAIERADLLGDFARDAILQATYPVTSQLSLLECMVIPIREGRSDIQADYEALFRLKVQPVPIDSAIIRKAADLRARNRSLRTPDAIHAATALTFDCEAFVTNDPAFGRILGLPVRPLGTGF